MKLGILASLFFVCAIPLISFADEATPVASAPQEKAEDQIPVDFSKVKKAGAGESTSGRLFMSFGIMLVVLGGGYYLAKRFGRPANKAQTRIKILTQHYIGPKKSLAIVHVAGESVLIGITDHTISMIKSLSLIDDEVPESVSNQSFKDTLSNKKEEEASSASGEEFSIRHIKDVVSLKLKGMRNEL